MTESKLSLGSQISKALFSEYKNIFFHTSSNDGNNSSAQIMIDKNLLLIFHNRFKGNQIKQNQKQENYKKKPFKTSLEQSPVSNIQGNLEYINPKSIEITGYAQNELIGKTINLIRITSGKLN